MSVQRSIKLKIVAQNKTPIDCLQVLLTDFWTPFNPNGKIRYLPLGDTEDFNFKDSENLSDVLNIIDTKLQNNEFGLIVLWDKNHWEAIDLFIRSKEPTEIYNCFNFEFSLGIGKRLPDSKRYTDFSYYLNRIIPPLEENGFHFEEVVCSDFG